MILLGPDLKEELPVLYLRLRDAADERSGHANHRAHAEGDRTDPYAWRSRVLRAGHAGRRRDRRARPRPSIAEQLATGCCRHRRRAGQPRRVVGPTDRRAARAHRGDRPPPTVLPALRRGNVVGALQVGLRPGKSGLDSMGILDAAANGKIECLILLGADPVSDCPDADLGRRGVAGAASIIAIDTFLTDSVAARRRGVAGRRVRREGRLHHQPRGSGHRGRPAGHRRRHVAADWMVAAELRRPPRSRTSRSPRLADVTAAIATTVDGYEVDRACGAGRQRRGRARRRPATTRSTRRGFLSATATATTIESW